jgi:hypothetical protein
VLDGVSGVQKRDSGERALGGTGSAKGVGQAFVRHGEQDGVAIDDCFAQGNGAGGLADCGGRGLRAIRRAAADEYFVPGAGPGRAQADGEGPGAQDSDAHVSSLLSRGAVRATVGEPVRTDR